MAVSYRTHEVHSATPDGINLIRRYGADFIAIGEQRDSRKLHRQRQLARAVGAAHRR